MTDRLKSYSAIPFLAAALCFFLPFINVSCGDQRVSVAVTGIQLVTGATIATPPGSPSSKGLEVDAEPFAVLALLCAPLGIAATFVKSRAVAVVPASLGAAGAALLLLLKSKLDSDILKQGRGMFHVEYRFAYWCACLLFLLACALNAYILVKRSRRAAEMPQAETGVSGPA